MSAPGVALGSGATCRAGHLLDLAADTAVHAAPVEPPRLPTGAAAGHRVGVAKTRS